MRIVEPSHFNHKTGVTKKRFVKKLATVLIVVLIVSGGTAFALMRKNSKPAVSENTQINTQINTETKSQESQNSTVQPTPPTKSDTPKLRTFADNDFKNFYDQLMLPNLLPVENPPVISGNNAADVRIRQIAESRGYRLRSSPSGDLSSVDGQPIQPSVVESWKGLKAAASAAGLQISIVSSYRSVENQRSLFLSRLATTGATIEQVAAGNADDKVNTVLITSSIPGYSKHHTGYTVDLQCAGWDFENFKNSICNTWISADNYKVAKQNGFMPSYPPAADIQGPDPEAWEYVWVGTEHLYE